MFDGKAFAADVLDGLRAHVDKAMGPALLRIADLEAKNARLTAVVDALPVPAEIPDIQRMVTDAVAAIPPAPGGKDADPAEIVRLVDEAVSRIPVPQDGKDADEAALDMAVAKAIAALPPAPAGEAGKDADLDQVKQFIVAEVAKGSPPENDHEAQLLRINRILDESDPRFVFLEESARRVAEFGRQLEVLGERTSGDTLKAAVAEMVAEIPRPENGKSVTLQDVAPLIEEAVQRAAVALPVPKDGVGVAGALIDRSGALVLTLTDGSTRDLGQVVGKDGQPGVNGRDGVDSSAPDAVEVYRDPDNGLIEFKFVYGEIAYAVTVQGNDGAKYRGVYQADTQYQKSDIVTWGGSAWHCNEETVDRPGEGSKAWTLMVKKGRDGKDGSSGAKGDPGKDGRDGRGWT